MTFTHIKRDDRKVYPLTAKKYKSRTSKRKIASMKAFYTYLEEKQIISENPFRRIRMKFKEEKVLPRIIPKNDIERLLNYMYGQLRKQKGKSDSDRGAVYTQDVEEIYQAGRNQQKYHTAYVPAFICDILD